MREEYTLIKTKQFQLETFFIKMQNWNNFPTKLEGGKMNCSENIAIDINLVY